MGRYSISPFGEVLQTYCRTMAFDKVQPYAQWGRRAMSEGNRPYFRVFGPWMNRALLCGTQRVRYHSFPSFFLLRSNWLGVNRSCLNSLKSDSDRLSMKALDPRQAYLTFACHYMLKVDRHTIGLGSTYNPMFGVAPNNWPKQIAKFFQHGMKDITPHDLSGFFWTDNNYVPFDWLIPTGALVEGPYDTKPYVPPALPHARTLKKHWHYAGIAMLGLYTLGVPFEVSAAIYSVYKEDMWQYLRDCCMSFMQQPTIAVWACGGFPPSVTRRGRQAIKDFVEQPRRANGTFPNPSATFAEPFVYRWRDVMMSGWIGRKPRPTIVHSTIKSRIESGDDLLASGALPFRAIRGTRALSYQRWYPSTQEKRRLSLAGWDYRDMLESIESLIQREMQ